MPRIKPSVFGILGSVKSKNLVPVKDWKTVSLKKLVSMLSMPVAGTSGIGLRKPEVFPDPLVVGAEGSSEDTEYAGNLGVSDFVMA